MPHLRLPRGSTPYYPAFAPQALGGSLDRPSEDSLPALPTLSGSPRCLSVSRRASRAHLCPSRRYGAADLPDADLKLRERLGHALPVAFGILWRQRVLIRAYLAPTLPSRRPGR